MNNMTGMTQELNSKYFAIPSIVKDEWDKWNIRGTVLVSLLLQTLLIFIAPLRKRTEKRIITLFIWAAYLLADWVAAFAVGLIFSAQGNHNGKELVNKDIAVFWAPFLLLHLGGPDTITAFALEDNELWLRHLLSLMVQFVAVAYVFLQSLPNEFWTPTLLMFVAGTIKYAERTRALYLACLGNFKASMLPKPEAGIDYPRLMEEYSSNMEAHVPVKIVFAKEVKKRSHRRKDPIEENMEAQLSIKKPIEEIDEVNAAYKFFKIFKGLIVDLASSLEDRQESRVFMFESSPHDALRVMELELNFLYDVLYTKVPVVHCKRGFFFRLVCSVLIVISFQRFASHHKQHLHHLDIAVTYTLLIGALGLDLVAFGKLIFSDWTVALLKNSKMMSIVYAIRKKISIVGRRQWSNSVSRLSFIKYCVEEQYLNWFDKPAIILGLDDLLAEMQYVTKTKPPNELMEFIFNELKYKAFKAQDPKDAKKMCSARGSWVLSQSFISLKPQISSTVSEEVEYDESLLLWHIATELCYFKCHEPEKGDGIYQNREFCKILSDYMLYLIVMQPTIMSAVAGTSQFRFRDTCAEAKKFFHKNESNPENIKKFFHLQSKKATKQQMRDVCNALLAVNIVGKPVELKGERSKSLLFDACILAKDLMKLRPESMWEIMSKVWVELLCYAASHCKPNAYAQHLSKGGELITFVWLLMAHFGLREEFRKNDIPNFKLIVAK